MRAAARSGAAGPGAAGEIFLPWRTKNAISLPKISQLSCELGTAKAQNRAEAIALRRRVSQQTSSSERGDRLLRGETAGKQLISDNASVPILRALQLPHHFNDGSCTFLLFRASIVDGCQYEPMAASV